MNKTASLILFSLLCISAPIAFAAPSLDLVLSPEPIYGQIWVYETYLVNVTLQDFNMSEVDLTGYTGTPSEYIFEGTILWKAKGGFDYGHATTGYNYKLDDSQISFTAPLLTGSASYNLTLDKDAWDYGIKPYETVEVTLNLNIYLLMSDDTVGPKVASKTAKWSMVDQTKVDYLEGKFLNMQEEIYEATNANGLMSLNRDAFLNILEAMNNSLTQGNYVEAQKTWQDYDEDDRTDLISALISASDLQTDELHRLEDVESQLISAEQENQRLQEEYDLLDATYNALSNTYHKVNADLDSAKRNLSTAITAVFLTAILFYFLGRRGITGKAD